MLNLFDNALIWFWTCLMLDLFDTGLAWFGTHWKLLFQSWTLLFEAGLFCFDTWLIQSWMCSNLHSSMLDWFNILLDSFDATLDLFNTMLDLFVPSLSTDATCLPLPLLVFATHLLLPLFCHVLSSDATQLPLPLSSWLICPFLSFAACYQVMHSFAASLFSTSPCLRQLMCCFLSFAVADCWHDSFGTTSCSPLPLVLYYLFLSMTCLPLPLPASYPPAVQLFYHEGTVNAKRINDSGHLHVFLVLCPWLIFPLSKATQKIFKTFSVHHCTNSTKTGLSDICNNPEKSF